MNNQFRVLAFAIGDWQKIRYENIFADQKWVIKIVEEWDENSIIKFKPDIILTYADSYYAVKEITDIARSKKIPSLLIEDGLIEWRHQWENPRFGFGDGIPYFQQLNVDKIACYGSQGARILESWGNINKCEITGAARFDIYKKIKRKPHKGPKRILVLSANTPYWTDEQKYLAIKGFKDIHALSKKRNDIELIWRLRKGFDKEIDYANDNNKYGSSLIEIMPYIDGAISQPSTVALETMMVGIPTAIIDYQNSPNYIRSGWSITASEHINKVLDGLCNPAQNQILFQDELLNDQLYWQESATERVRTLIFQMIISGKESRENSTELIFPRRIIPMHLEGHSPTSEYFDYQKLYPSHPIFSKKSTTDLQKEIIYLKQKIKIIDIKIGILEILKRIIKRIFNLH